MLKFYVGTTVLWCPSDTKERPRFHKFQQNWHVAKVISAPSTNIRIIICNGRIYKVLTKQLKNITHNCENTISSSNLLVPVHSLQMRFEH